MEQSRAQVMYADITSKPIIDPISATELITAAWKLYRTQGWADRANRCVVTEPIYAVQNIPEQNVHTGDQIVPSLYETVIHNAIALQESVADIPLENAIQLAITAEIRGQAAADREAVINDNVLRTLQDDKNDFRAKVAELLQADLIRYQDLKTLAYITTMADSVRAKAESDTLFDHARDAVLAPVDHTVDVTVQILSVRFNQNWNTYNHNGMTDDGCVVSFFHKTRHEPMSRVRVTAKVKTHGRVWHRPDLAETRLNYVKIVNTIKDVR
jgi:hypothetical protein